MLVAVLGGAVGIGTAAAVWEFLPAGRQSACVVLHISDQQPFVSQATPEGQVNAAVYRQRQQQAVSSMKVLETALAKPAIADLTIFQKANPVGELERRIKTDFKLGQEFMRITVEGDTPEESLILVAAIKDAYLSEVVNKERSIWNRSVARREEALKDAEATFERNRAELTKKLEPFNLKPADAAFIPRLRQFAEEKHQQKESELRQVQARLRTLELEEKADAEEDGNNLAVPAAAIDEELDREPQLVILRAKTVALEQELTVNTTATKSDSTLPAIVKLRKEVESARQAEAEFRKSARPRIEGRLAEREREKRRAEGLARKREMDRYRDWQTAPRWGHKAREGGGDSTQRCQRRDRGHRANGLTPGEADRGGSGCHRPPAARSGERPAQGVRARAAASELARRIPPAIEVLRTGRAGRTRTGGGRIGRGGTLPQSDFRPETGGRPDPDGPWDTAESGAVTPHRRDTGT